MHFGFESGSDNRAKSCKLFFDFFNKMATLLLIYRLWQKFVVFSTYSEDAMQDCDTHASITCKEHVRIGILKPNRFK
jgi:hypothetical protein